MIIRKHREGDIFIIASCDNDEGYELTKHAHDRRGNPADPILKDVLTFMFAIESSGLNDFLDIHPSIVTLQIFFRGIEHMMLHRKNVCKSKQAVKIHSQDAMFAMIDNLHDVIQQAGGAVSAFSTERLKEMSAFELLNNISTNSIRFTYKGK